MGSKDLFFVSLRMSFSSIFLLNYCAYALSLLCLSCTYIHKQHTACTVGKD